MMKDILRNTTIVIVAKAEVKLGDLSRHALEEIEDHWY